MLRHSIWSCILRRPLLKCAGERGSLVLALCAGTVQAQKYIESNELYGTVSQPVCLPSSMSEQLWRCLQSGVRNAEVCRNHACRALVDRMATKGVITGITSSPAALLFTKMMAFSGSSQEATTDPSSGSSGLSTGAIVAISICAVGEFLDYVACAAACELLVSHL